MSGILVVLEDAVGQILAGVSWEAAAADWRN